MKPEEYARGSPFTCADWRSAERALADYGFSPEDSDAVLRAAFANGFHPRRFALAAVALRAHCEAGLPLGGLGR